MSLADRIRSQAAISARPGQYEELEAIAVEVEALEGERDAARESARILGQTLHEINMQLVEVTGSEDCIDESGDGDWEAVYERLQEMTGVREQRDTLQTSLTELTDSWNDMARRADRYAQALTKVVHSGPHLLSECKPDVYDACEAARWLSEREGP